MILRRYLSAPTFNHNFHYLYVIGSLNFLKKSTEVEISYATYQVFCFWEDPFLTHWSAIKHLDGYLCGTREDGFILDPNRVTFEVYDDADFYGKFYRPTVIDNILTAKSQSRNVLLYTGFPIV